MGYKNNDRVLNKIGPDEPIFCLRAQDRTSIHIIQTWLEGTRETLSPEHVQEVRTLIDDFAHWQAVNASKVKEPD